MLGIGAIVVVLLLCCCVVVVIAALTIMGPAVGKVFSTINSNQKFLTPMPGFPTLSPDSTFPQSPSDLIPQGGRGDEIVRASAWGYVIAAGALDGCSYNPKAADATIKVTQEPDSDGIWKEEWTVACDDGSKKPYNVTFTPSASGGTDIKVTSGQ